MSGIFGHLNLDDSDRVFNATQGQRAIYDVAMEYVNKVIGEMNAVYSCFIAETTSDFKRRYKLPGGGYLQKVGPNSKPGAVKAYGSWDVAFPLEEWAAGSASNRVERAYMSVAELENHLATITTQHVNTVRNEILKALMQSGQDTFIDPEHGSLAIEPLANNDAVVYPPVLGSVAEAAENHYYGSNYTAASISDTNNPFETIRTDLEEHFGVQSGGSNIVVFIHPDQKAKTEALTDYDAYVDRFIQPGADTDRPTNAPAGLPGITLGRTNGCWVQEWRFMPTGYLLGLHLDAPKPLIKRIDPADTGLGNGDLQLIAENEDFPFNESYWSARFGLGCGNRLNGVAVQLVASTSYSNPTLV